LTLPAAGRSIAGMGKLAWALLLLAPDPVAGAEITHDAVGCLVAERFPRLEARVVPADGVARVRLSFRPEGGTYWYSVVMNPEGEVFAGVLPKPRKSLKGLRYYIEATDRELRTTRTAEHEVLVASGPAACQDAKVATSLASAQVALEVPAGAPAVPAGFSSAGIGAAAAGVVAGAATGAAVAGAAAGGGGATTVLLVAGGVAAAAGAAVVATGGLGGGDEDGSQDGSTGGPTVYELTFGPPPGVDIRACTSAANAVTVSQTRVTVGSDGRFDTLQPGNSFRWMGQVNDTSFTGSLSCVNVAISGPFNATGSRAAYQGEWTFATQGGVFTATRVSGP
jgi:hypothetical protein